MTIKSILSCVILSIFTASVLSANGKELQKAKVALKKEQEESRKAEITAKRAEKVAKKAETAKPSYPFPKLLLKNQNEEQLELSLAYGKEVNDKELVFKAFYHLISQSKSQEKIKIYKIDYADYTFGIEDYEKALMAYEEFCMLYPGSQESEYAQYKAILCNFFLSLSFDRDQTLTQRTVSSALLFLQKVKDEKFLKETENIYKSCRQRLFDHEVYVLETYLKLKKFSSARKRIEYIQENFKDIENLELYIAYCNKVYDIVHNPKSCPFMIQLNLNHALDPKKEIVDPSKLRRAVPLFLA